MAVFDRITYKYFDADIIADEIEKWDYYENYNHNIKNVPIMDFAYELEDDDGDGDFLLTKEEESVIIKEVTEELRKRGWK